MIYIRYLQIFRRLEVAYDQMVHPQKRQDMRRALEACMGRMLEVRHWMVRRQRSHARVHACMRACMPFFQVSSAQLVPAPLLHHNRRRKRRAPRRLKLSALRASPPPPTPNTHTHTHRRGPARSS